jgi:hypothetical protein
MKFGIQGIRSVVDGLTTTTSNIITASRNPTGFDRTLPDLLGEISFDNSTRILEIAPKSGQTTYQYYHSGVLHTETEAKSVQIGDIEGEHFIYFTSEGVLTAVPNPNHVESLIYGEVLVAIVNWDADNNKQILLGDERHGLMDGFTHLHLHTTLGSLFESGFKLNNVIATGNGSSSTHCQFGVDFGVFRDEDITFEVTALPTPAQIPIYYYTGTHWRIKEANDNPFIASGEAGYTGAGGRIAYNLNATSLAEVSNNDYIIMNYFATNDSSRGNIAGVLGQQIYLTPTAARNGMYQELDNIFEATGFPSPEFLPIAGAIFQTGSYANTQKARIVTLDTGEAYLNYNR